MTFEQILSELKKKQYRPIYFLMGEEPYFIDVITDYIAEHALAEQEKAFNQVVVYGKDTTVYTVLDAAKRFPMMSQHQVVIVKEAQHLKEIDKLQFYVEKPLKSTILVISHKYKTLDKRLKLYKILDKSKDVAVLDSQKLRDYKVPEWITAYVTERGYTIVPAAASLLTEYLGAELGKVANELSKLIITLPVNEKKITLEHIETNVGISKDYNVFELQNALGAKDVLKANRIIDHFARNPNSNPMVMTIASLYGYFVKILTYHYLPDKSQAASALKVPPFYVKDYEAAARKYPAPKIVQIISALREYDLKSKGVGSSSASDGDLMRELVFRILH
jgi:DNA polymerase-3 subunit delta